MMAGQANETNRRFAPVDSRMMDSLDPDLDMDLDLDPATGRQGDDATQRLAVASANRSSLPI